MLRQLLCVLVIVPHLALASGQITGVWESADENLRFDILDGFKPNRGAVLSISNGNETEVGWWEVKNSETSIRVGWTTGSIVFRGPDSFEWQDKFFTRRSAIVEGDVVFLKENETEFINRMKTNIWLTSSEGEQSVFKSTFSLDAGVVEVYSNTGDLKALDSWGVSSGVLKIDDTVIVEARASDDYLIGQNHEDEFVVFRAIRGTMPQGRIELAEQREEFLTKLVTDTWQQTYYSGYYYFEFRPVEGPLKGRVIHLENESFEGARVWEYSPSTGALRIGYTDYVGGLVIGDTLALLEEDGDQEFYKRKPEGVGRTFTVADVGVYQVNETKMLDIRSVLEGQFQYDDYLYTFEFDQDARTGFIHKWRSEPFATIGQQLSNEFLGQIEVVYALNEYFFFDERFALKRDASASRLRTKTEGEVIEDQKELRKKLESLDDTTIVLRVTDLKGNVSDFTLPYGSMADIGSIQLMIR